MKTKEDRMAERGAKFLDRRIPQWRKLVAREDFDIGKGRFCIAIVPNEGETVGQVFGRDPKVPFETGGMALEKEGYMRGVEALGLTSIQAEALGFIADGGRGRPAARVAAAAAVGLWWNGCGAGNGPEGLLEMSR